jgi:hypothetical protein
MRQKRFKLFQRDRWLKPTFEFTKRDLEILKLIYEYRFLTAEHLSLLLEINYKTIIKRLQRLFHWGFLDRPKSQMADYILKRHKLIHTLGKKGVEILTEKLGLDRERLNRLANNTDVREMYLHHAMMISNFKTCLALALRKTEAKIIDWNSQDEMKKIKQELEILEGNQKKKVVIIPDSIFVIEDKGDEMYFMLEADLSTMTNKRFLDKMRGYWQLWKQGLQEKWGFKNFRVLTITKSEARKENLRKITKQADDRKVGSLMFWFTSTEKYSLKEPENILKPIWQTPKDDTFHSILE